MLSAVPIDDRGLLLGDGLFETVLYKAGRPVLWDAHLDRLARGCAALGLPAPGPAEVRAQADAAAAGLDRAAVRLTWTAGSGGRGLVRPAELQSRLIVSAAPSPEPQGSASVIVSSVRRNAGSPASRLKSLAYLDNVLARREATAAGADEALMLNTDGRLACASAANLFWIVGGQLFTPTLECGVLDGVVRAAILALADVRQVQAGPEAMAAADGAFLTNSLIGVRSIASIGGRVLPEHRLAAALRQEVEALI